MVSITTRLLCAATLVHVINGYTSSSTGQHIGHQHHQSDGNYYYNGNLPQQKDTSAVDSNANDAMAQYEAALKAAFESASVPPSPSLQSGGNTMYGIPTIRYERDTKNDHNTDATMTISGLEDKGRVEDTAPTASSWDVLAQDIHSMIDTAEEEEGKLLTDDARDDIIAALIAGSIVGTAVGSPLLVGATFGCAGTQLFQGEQADRTKEVLGKVGRELLEQAKVQANAALAYTKEHIGDGQTRRQLIHEEPSKVTKKILLAIQERAHQVHDDIQAGPTHLVEHLKKSVHSEDLKTLPNRSFKALHAFLGSDEVQQARNRAVKAIKDGLESDEMKALKNRAAQAVRDTLHAKED